MTNETRKETPDMLSAAALGEYFGLGERRVQQLSRAGVIPKSARGRYSLRDSVQSYTEYLRTLAEGHDGSIDFGIERARLTKEQADATALKNARTRGELVSVEEVTALFAKVAGETKTRVLGVPTKVAPRVIGLTDMRAVKQVIEDDIREALTELTRGRNGLPDA